MTEHQEFMRKSAAAVYAAMAPLHSINNRLGLAVHMYSHQIMTLAHSHCSQNVSMGWQLICMLRKGKDKVLLQAFKFH